MTVQTFTLLNNGTVDLTVTGIEFNTPVGIAHLANLSNFSGGSPSYESNSFSTTTTINSGTYKIFTLDYGFDGAASNIYLRDVEITSDQAPLAILKSTIIVGKGSLNSPATLSNSGETFTDYQENPINGFSFITFKIKSDGGFEITNSSQGSLVSSNWVDPYPFDGVGNNFYVRFTRTSLTGSGVFSASETTDWKTLSVNREFTVNATGLSDGTPSTTTCIFTVEISDDISGSPLLSSGTYTFNPTGKLAGLITNIPNIEINDYNSPDSRAYVRINRNGNIEFFTQTINNITVSSIWYLNGGGSIGDNFFINVTKINGVLPDTTISNELDTFLQINENKKWGLVTLDFRGFQRTNLKVEIANNDKQVLSTFNVTISVNTPPPPVFYGVEASASNITEGESVTFFVKTTYVPVDTIIYWRLVDKLGNLKKEDFANYELVNPLSGSFTVEQEGRNQTPVLNKGIALTSVFSSVVGNNRSFSMIIRDVPFADGGVSDDSTFRAESQQVNISDAAPSYSISVDKSSVDEGSNVKFTINTSNVENGTQLYWGVTSRSNVDFYDLNGSSYAIDINNNTGELYLTIVEDRKTEGNEKFQLILYGIPFSIANYFFRPIVATSPEVTIIDTSLSPTYSISTDGVTSVNEGNSIVFHVRTTNVLNGTQLWYLIFREASYNDFVSYPSSPITVNGNYARMEFVVKSDSLTDPNETMEIRLWTKKPNIFEFNSPVAASEIVYINDTSTTPAPVYYYWTQGGVDYGWDGGLSSISVSVNNDGAAEGGNTAANAAAAAAAAAAADDAAPGD